MNLLKEKEEEAQAKVEELQAKVKTLEQENLAKEQEITSLSHKNQLLETEVEKLETGIKEAKGIADVSDQQGSQNEALQRRLQLLEEEAEQADISIRETNEKYVLTDHGSSRLVPPLPSTSSATRISLFFTDHMGLLDYVKPM